MSATPTMPSTRAAEPSKLPRPAKIDVFVTVVAPLRNDAAIVQQFVREAVSVLDRTYTYYELLLIDDGSSDETVIRVQELLDAVSCIRLIRLSRQFGDEIAIYAGLENAIGDFVVSLMPATDPPELIPDFVDRARRIGGVVIGVRNTARAEPLGSRIGAKLFYAICNHFLALDVPEESTHFRA